MLRARYEFILARLPRRPHCRYDAAATAGDFFVACARQTEFEFLGAVSAIHKMSVAVDQTWRDPASGAIDAVRCVECGRVGVRAGIDDKAVFRGNEAVVDETQAPALRRKRCEATSVPDAVNSSHDGGKPAILRYTLGRLPICLYILHGQRTVQRRPCLEDGLSQLYFEKALLPDGWAADVTISIDGGHIATVKSGARPLSGDERHAIGLPGLPNL